MMRSRVGHLVRVLVAIGLAARILDAKSGHDPDALIGDLLATGLLAPTQADSQIAEVRPQFSETVFACLHALRVKIAAFERAFDERCAARGAGKVRLVCMEQNPLLGGGFILTDLEIAMRGRVAWTATTTGRAALASWSGRQADMADFDSNVYSPLHSTFGSRLADEVRAEFVREQTASVAQYVSRLTAFVACEE